MSRTAPLYDGRFWRLFAGTVTLSAAVTSVALVPASNAPAPIMDHVGKTLGLFVFAVVIGGISAILPAVAVWALLWRGLADWRLGGRGRAILSVVLAVIAVPLMLTALLNTAKAMVPFAGFSLIVVLMGLPAALIIGPALAAWIYKDAP